MWLVYGVCIGVVGDESRNIDEGWNVKGFESNSKEMNFVLKVLELEFLLIDWYV